MTALSQTHGVHIARINDLAMQLASSGHTRHPVVTAVLAILIIAVLVLLVLWLVRRSRRRSDNST
jgi:uncharacterized membrane protein YidH (DUF202 family)